ncbi:HAD family hydrolase [Clostridium fallax]|uniref:Haloacid dehalogenase superfamily, subfamily IA, variant 3 with third motif having DD or ED n=1 Tax=Clostridium fallax TaxID=1533 RepID=A0A1M4VPU8_9CLOT|nr:HAD family phosphatase [Clostridium fallax]SHE70895.1 haloacid dehalogenase superfamily, subfamily IA, variant 3 with third motif having DD or ED [Clostridium fallax]SQB22824.1 haloacid dehalogenase superfamily, subfamily IA, variant 3 with third motif having DD or ED [Clostridium fallax]
MLNNIKAAIFDLDGTLADSMWVWKKIDIDFLNDRNLNAPKNLISDICHLSFEQCASYFKERFNLTESVQDIMTCWHNMAYENYKEKVKLKSGAKNLLLHLKSCGIKIALATSNSKPLLEATLKANGIYDLFDVITTTDEVLRGKNFPDVYLLTAKKLNVNPKDCIVFEDILPAVKGAKSAGMKVIAVYDEHSLDQMPYLKEEADKYINNFDELAI